MSPPYSSLTFKLKDLIVHHALPVRRNDGGKTVIQQCDIELQNWDTLFRIDRKEVLRQLLDYCYESANDEPLTTSMFNFMYRNCVQYKPSAFTLKVILTDAIYHAGDVEITFITDGENVVEIPQKKPLQLDDMFYTTCRDTLSSLNKDMPVFNESKGTKEMVRINRFNTVCSVFRANLITEGLMADDNIILEITQLPKYYTIAVRIKCGGGYVQPVPTHTNDGLVCMENNDVLHGVLKQTLENLDVEVGLGNLSKLKGRKAWDKYNPNLWFSDKNKLERENYLFFL